MLKLKNILKNIGLFLGILLAGYLINTGGFFLPSSEVADLTTASVLTPEFKEIVAENTFTQCAFQDEINQKFESLEASSSNYEVLYEVAYSKYDTKKYNDCEIPKSKIDELGLTRVNKDLLGEIPVISEIKDEKSQIFPKIDSTYYEKAYGYVPERPTPIAKY